MNNWIKTKADELAVANGCYFDEKAANHARTFIETFLNVKPKKPFLLYPWQWESVVAPIFGWKQENGLRRFRVAYIEIPKKNGKSLIISACLLYLLMADGEHGAEIYVAAYTAEQAGVIFREAAKLVRNSPKVSKVCNIVDTRKVIEFPHTSSFLKVISRDSNTAQGVNAHAIGFDEIHVQKTRDQWDCLRYAGAARKQPLILGITTAGFDKQSLCWELHEQTLNVNSGLTPQDDYYGCIFAADEKDDWTKEATWIKANPSYGLSLNPKDFASECLEAQQSSGKENSFRRYRLCQWTESETAWITQEKWQACKQPFVANDLAGKTCYLGIDLSISTAFTALVLVFPFEDNTYKILPFFFLPKQTITDMRGRLPYDVWERQGLIQTIEGNVIDYDRVRSFVKQLGLQYNIKQIALDPFNAQNFETQLQNDGFKVFKMIQNYTTLSPLSKEFERLILQQKIIHNGNAIMDWMLSCTAIRTDAEGNIKPVKPDRNTSTNCIDGVIATIMALGLAIYRQTDSNRSAKSVYETRGLLTF